MNKNKYTPIIELVSMAVVNGEVIKYRNNMNLLNATPSVAIFDNNGGIVYCMEYMQNRIESVIDYFNIQNVKVVII